MFDSGKFLWMDAWPALSVFTQLLKCKLTAGFLIILSSTNRTNALPPCVEWESVGFSPRLEHSMAFDSRRGVAVLFGNFLAESSDTWEWDSKKWELVSRVGPSPRYGHAMAYDSKRGVTVLFGGTAKASGGNETWEWDGQVWTLRSSEGPSYRRDHALAYDSSRGVVIMFGGRVSGGQLSNETWEWNGHEWVLRSTKGPVPRYHHAMSYDSRRGVTLLYGGNGGDRPGEPGLQDDLWEWDGDTWVQRVAPGPSKRQSHAMAYDSTRGVTVLVGGTGQTNSNKVWEWDGFIWRHVKGKGPPGISSHAMVFDSKREHMILFGGSIRTSFSEYSGVTWAWNGKKWKTLDQGGPRGRAYHAMAYDSSRDVTVMFGGVIRFIGGPPYVWENGTWEFDGLEWWLRSTEGPSRRAIHAMTYDSKRRVTVLFGGVDDEGVNGETWEWDGMIWSLRSVNGPSPRSWHAMAYDSRRRVTVLFGGHAVLKGGNRGLSSETWEWDGETWTRKSTDGPAPRYRTAMAFDKHRGVTVLFGGEIRTGYGISNDTWEWDGVQWTAKHSSSQPNMRRDHAMAYDETNELTVLFGGDGDDEEISPSDDLWVWNGKNWKKRAGFDELRRHPDPLTVTGAYPRAAHSMVYNSQFGRVFLYGGSPTLVDSWLFALHSNTPDILQDPQDRVFVSGCGIAQFTVQAVADGDLNYQWRKHRQPLKDGGRISGATTATLTISDVAASDDRTTYDVIVSSDECSITSRSATLRVNHCKGDIYPHEGDSEINVEDLAAIFLAWGPCTECCEDLNDDGVVDDSDMSRLLFLWQWERCP